MAWSYSFPNTFLLMSGAVRFSHASTVSSFSTSNSVATSLKILTASSMTYFSFATVRLLTSDRFPCPMKNFTISLSS